MKIQVVADEWYPVYCFCKSSYNIGQEVDVPDAFFKRVQAANEEFKNCQQELADLYDTADRKKRNAAAAKGERDDGKFT